MSPAARHVFAASRLTLPLIKPEWPRRHGTWRRLTLSLLQAHPAKLSIAKKRFAAALYPAILEEIVCGDGILEKQ